MYVHNVEMKVDIYFTCNTRSPKMSSPVDGINKIVTGHIVK